MYKRFMRDSMYKWVVMYQLSKPKPQSHNCPFLSTTPHRTHLLETTELYHVFVPRELFPHLVTVLVKHPCPLVLSVILIALIKYASLYAINQKHFSLQIFLSWIFLFMKYLLSSKNLNSTIISASSYVGVSRKQTC